MARHTDALAEQNVTTLVVTFAEPGRARTFAEAFAPPGTLLCDPERTVYRAFGLGRASTREVFSVKTLLRYAKHLLRGRLPKPPDQDIHQMGGDFVVDREGAVWFAHRSTSPIDRPDAGDLVAAARGER